MQLQSWAGVRRAYAREPRRRCVKSTHMGQDRQNNSSPRAPGKARAPYVVVAGTIAAGKSTVAERLASSFGIPAYLEEPQRNPFLESFYADPQRWGFTSQLWFLLDTCTQHRAIVGGSAGGIQDHSPDEGVEVYSEVLRKTGKLTSAELELLRDTLTRLRADLPAPDLVVHLRARPEELLERIRGRGRHYERGIQLDYLTALDLARINLFSAWDSCPVVVIDTEELDARTDNGLEAITQNVAVHLSKWSPGPIR
jgi:deoxyadenosine/deoxycytidine kinase